ncbi:MAG TPA: hypothetical protein PLB62_11065, partial [Candidatus Sumerlaeota bacterium]|nr:hypothetical protein [Candidatus Sumerlaeota bacterium]
MAQPSETCIVLRHLADLPEALRIHEQMDRPSAFVCLSPQVLFTLKKELGGRASIRSIWEYADYEKISAVLDDLWFGLSRLTQESPRSLIHNLAHSLFVFSYELIASENAVQSMLLKDRPAGIILFSPAKPYPVIPPVYKREDRDCTLEFCLRHHCRKAGISLTVLQTRVKPPDPPDSFRRTGRISDKAAFLLSRARGLWNLAKTALFRKPYVLAYGSMIDYVNILPHMKELGGGVNALCVGWLSDELFSRHRSEIDRGMITPRDFEILGLFDMSGARRKFDRDLSDYFQSLSDRYSIAPDHPVLNRQKRFILKSLVPQAVRFSTGLRRFVRHSRPRAFVTANLLNWLSTLFLSCAPANAPRICVQHGGFGYVPIPECSESVDAIAVWGEIQKDLVRRSGFKGVILKDRPPVQYAAGGRAAPPPPLPRPPLSILLCTSAQGEFSTPLWMPEETRFSSITALMDWCEQTPDASLRIRPHPRFDYRETYRVLIQGRTKSAMVPDEESLDESVRRASMVCMVGYFSTLLVHAAVCG